MIGPFFRNSTVRLVIVLSVGLIARLLLAISTRGNFDQQSYHEVWEILQSGGNVYAEFTRYNYSPVWMVVLGTLGPLETIASVPLYASSKIALSFIDLACVLLIARASQKPSLNVKVVVSAYWLNPGAIVLTGFHGQFEVLAAFFLLLGLVVDGRAASAISTGASAIVKHNILPIAWCQLVYHFRLRNAILIMLTTGVVFCILLLPFLPEGSKGILQNVILYRSSSYVGISHIIPENLSLLIFAIISMSLPVVMRNWGNTLPFAIGVSSLAFVTFIPGLAIQYFTFVLLFTLFLGKRAVLWQAGLGILIVIFYVFFDQLYTPLLNLCWVWTGSWFGIEFARMIRNRMFSLRTKVS